MYLTYKVFTIFFAILPIKVSLKDCTSLHMRPIKDIGLFQAIDGKLKPVPFQIDERRKDGSYRMDWIFEGGEWIREKLEKGDLYLTPEDELIFEETSLGKRHFFDEKISGCEIEIPEKGFVYLLTLPHPQSSEKVFIYDREKRIFKSPFFSFGFTDETHTAVLNFMDTGGGDILDRFKMTLSFSFFFGKLKVVKTEDDMVANITGYREGPLRGLLKQRFRMEILKGVATPWAERVTEIYKKAVIFPSDLFIPFGPGLLITDAELLVSLDFNKKMKGAFLWTEKFKRPVLIDGKTSEREKNLNGSEFPRWVALKTRFGTMVGIVRGDETLEKAPLEKSFFYRDDENYESKNKEERGSIGELGWRIKGLEKLKRGRYRFDVIITKINEKSIDDVLSLYLREISINIKDLKRR